jgi:hypothetical protein
MASSCIPFCAWSFSNKNAAVFIKLSVDAAQATQKMTYDRIFLGWAPRHVNARLFERGSSSHSQGASSPSRQKRAVQHEHQGYLYYFALAFSIHYTILSTIHNDTVWLNCWVLTHWRLASGGCPGGLRGMIFENWAGPVVGNWYLVVGQEPRAKGPAFRAYPPPRFNRLNR